MIGGAVVVDNQVQNKLVGHTFVDGPQEAHELLMSVTRLAFGDLRTGAHIQSLEQGRGAAADGVMGHPLHVASSIGRSG